VATKDLYKECRQATQKEVWSGYTEVTQMFHPEFAEAAAY
jgi:hypothetical protein